jgi:hypothetical protein
MRNLIRNPLTWLVVAEFVVVGALIAVAWNVAGNAARAALGTPSLSIPAQASDTVSPLPDIPGAAGPAARGPMPGLNLDSAFWRERLKQLNRDQVILEQMEWRIVHGAMDAIHRYLETVVMPSIQAAEAAGGGVPVP